MESYSDSFVTWGLLDKEPKPVAIRWVGGWRSSNADGLQEVCVPAGMGCTSPSTGGCGKRRVLTNSAGKWETGNHPLGHATVGAAG